MKAVQEHRRKIAETINTSEIDLKELKKESQRLDKENEKLLQWVCLDFSIEKKNSLENTAGDNFGFGSKESDGQYKRNSVYVSLVCFVESFVYTIGYKAGQCDEDMSINGNNRLCPREICFDDQSADLCLQRSIII